jgi:hypothetical protein
VVLRGWGSWSAEGKTWRTIFQEKVILYRELREIGGCGGTSLALDTATPLEKGALAPAATGALAPQERLLERIHGPQDVRALALEQLPALAKETRDRIIEVIARTGGISRRRSGRWNWPWR